MMNTICCNICIEQTRIFRIDTYVRLISGVDGVGVIYVMRKSPTEWFKLGK